LRARPRQNHISVFFHNALHAHALQVLRPQIVLRINVKAATMTDDCGGDGLPVPVLPNYIAGRFVPAQSSPATVDDFDPATGRVSCRIARSRAADVDAAVAAAAAALPSWSATSTAHRAALLDRIADEIERRAPELARLEASDAGKTLAMATDVDVPRAVANFRFFAGAVRHDSTHAHAMHDAINYDTRVPVGVCALISPWNLPLYLLSWKVAPALACGNTVVAKPSEITPRTASVLAEIIDKVGLPPGVFNLIHGYGGEAGAALVSHPGVRGVSFTGGTATGALVAAAAAPKFKKLSLELGGKNSTLVFADYDVDKAVAACKRAAFTNNGQICLAGSRVFVQRPLYDAFLPKFARAVAALRCGPPLDQASDIGPVSSSAHLEKIESYVALAREEGGVVECGGVRPTESLAPENCAGYFFAPTVLSGLPPTSRVSTEEIFGPVVTVHPFDTEDEAVAAANGVRYGLAASVWTNDLTTAHRVARRLESGIVWVNCWLHRDLRTPFGGVKDSGVGREGGTHSLEFFTEYKNTCVFIGAP
jgi:aminomuconate-semialdehyde/2-hydroxymuconate-6-semialdehyde dehydrogenase